MRVQVLIALLGVACLAVVGASTCQDCTPDVACTELTCGSTAYIRDPSKDTFYNPSMAGTKDTISCYYNPYRYPTWTKYAEKTIPLPTPKVVSAIRPVKTKACPATPYCGYTAGEISLITNNAPELYPDPGYSCPRCPVCVTGSAYALAVAGPKTCAVAVATARSVSVSAKDFEEVFKLYTVTIAGDLLSDGTWAGTCKATVTGPSSPPLTVVLGGPPLTIYSPVVPPVTDYVLNGFSSINFASVVTQAIKSYAEKVATASVSYCLRACVDGWTGGLCPASLCFNNGAAYASFDAYLEATAQAVAHAFTNVYLLVDPVCDQLTGSVDAIAEAVAASTKTAIRTASDYAKITGASRKKCDGEINRITVDTIAGATACTWVGAYLNALSPTSTATACTCALAVASDGSTVTCPTGCYGAAPGTNICKQCEGDACQQSAGNVAP